MIKHPSEDRVPLSLSNLKDWLAGTVAGAGDADVQKAGPQVGLSDPLERAAFLRAAAVLSTFDPRTLRPDTGSALLYTGASALRYVLPVSEPIENGPERGLWRLRSDVRHATLRAAGHAGLSRALAANPVRPSDPVQRSFEALVEGKLPDLDSASRDELVALLTATDWLTNVVNPLPARQDIKARLARVEATWPLRKLVGSVFVGRTTELAYLRDYVGVARGTYTSRLLGSVWQTFRKPSPVLVRGPGGVGKSSLVAKCLLDHIDGQDEALPFTYFDFDRPGIRADQPVTLLIESATQLASQLPEAKEALSDYAAEAFGAMTRTDRYEVSKSTIDLQWLCEAFAQEFRAAVPSTTPLLWALDTFEEVQFLGHDAVSILWQFLQQLQSSLPELRTVVAGRAGLDGLSVSDLPLADFDEPTALEVLRLRLHEAGARELSDTDARNLLSIIGTNPLSLRLGARLLRDQSVADLKTVSDRNFFFLRLKAEDIQARLHGRILKHLHDEQLERVAFPGLLVRRLTPQVLLDVLAKPCGLSLKTKADAESLFEKLSREVALIERDPIDGSLRHRPDVRRVMLRQLAEVPEATAKNIHGRAVEFYRSRKGPSNRAEEIYHRLKLREDSAAIDRRWTDRCAPYLRNAFEEFEPKTRLYLARKLGVSPSEDLIAQANQDEWEAITSARARAYLAAGNQRRALEVIQQRKERQPGSGLYLLEAEVQRLLGRNGEARAIAQRGLESAVKAGNPLVPEILLFIALLDESDNRLDDAIRWVSEAAAEALATGDDTARLRATIGRLRLTRKINASNETPTRLDDVPTRLAEQALTLVQDRPRVELRERPALFCEIVAELGMTDLDLLKEGVETIGFDLADEARVRRLAQGLQLWDSTLPSRVLKQSDDFWTVDPVGQLGAQLGLDSSGLEEWLGWLQSNEGPRLRRWIRQALEVFPIDSRVRSELVWQFQANVEASLKPPSPRRLAPRRTRPTHRKAPKKK